jgi:hypothetical protein
MAKVVNNTYAAIAGRADTRFKRAVEDTIAAIGSAASPLTPVDTGALRASLFHEMAGAYEGVVGYTVSYAPHVHSGHHTASGSFVPGQFFLTKASEGQRRPFEGRVSRAVEG